MENIDFKRNMTIRKLLTILALSLIILTQMIVQTESRKLEAKIIYEKLYVRQEMFLYD